MAEAQTPIKGMESLHLSSCNKDSHMAAPTSPSQPSSQLPPPTSPSQPSQYSPATSPLQPPSQLPPFCDSHATSVLTMFKKIIATGCIIKNQQRGEPDLSEQELCAILHTTMLQKPGAFLMQYGKYLDDSDLTCFDTTPLSDFEVSFRLKELRENLKQSSRTRMKTIRNRRYQYLKHLTEKSDYFSEEEMKQREPLLFEYYIGQFMDEDEKFKMDKNQSEMKLSSMILKNMEVDQRSQLLKEQLNQEADRVEEFDSSSDEGEASSAVGEDGKVLSPMKMSLIPEIAAREKFMLRQEFLAIMQTSFLDGKDKDIDYSKVDHNERYDSLEMRGKDAEDSYFDAEEPSWCEEDVHSDSSSGMELGTGEEKESGTTGTSKDEM